MYKLQNLDTRISCSFGKCIFLFLAEVCWDGNDRRIDLFAAEIRRRLLKASKLAGSDIGDCDCRFLVPFLVLYSESDGAFVLLRVCGGMAVGRVYRLETVPTCLAS
jgi:hypothetical protein